MGLEFIKKLFVKPTSEDLGCIYTFKRMYNNLPCRYTIRNCTEGFISLLKKESFSYQVLSDGTTVVVEGRRRNKEIDVEYGNENFAKELLRIKEGN